jgi:DNA-binding NarL/FixJ family response regulator
MTSVYQMIKVESATSATSVSRQAIRVVVFEETRMGCELLSHALESSRFGIKVVSPSCLPQLPGEDEKIDADIAIISSSQKDGPEAGFALVKKISTSNPLLRCIVLLDSGDKEFVVKAFRAGAVGVCEREQSYEVLCKCVYSVHSGQVWANSQQLQYVLDALVSGIPARVTDVRGKTLLSNREEQIVSLVAEGLKNREIAESLSLSEHTVKNHLFRIFERLGISSRAELILYLFSQKNWLKPTSEMPAG